jgi:hypothetical protein
VSGQEFIPKLDPDEAIAEILVQDGKLSRGYYRAPFYRERLRLAWSVIDAGFPTAAAEEALTPSGVEERATFPPVGR